MKQSEQSKLRSQAAKSLKWQLAFSSGRAATKRSDNTSSGIHSVRTWNEYVSALGKIAYDLGLKRLKELNQDIAITYLISRVTDGLSDKAISRDRVALERFIGKPLPSYQDIFKMKDDPNAKAIWLKGISSFINTKAGNPNSPLGTRKSRNPTPPKAGVGKRKTSSSRAGSKLKLKDVSRAYSDIQIKEIALSFNKEQDRLAVLLMRDAGLRVHELYTLRKITEGKPLTNQRDWRNDRHLHKEGVKYLVTGKGGLTREVVISKPLSERLERLRNSKPIKKNDRGVVYRQRYNLTAGNDLSKKFTLASKRELGFSLGAHGLRHSYAQTRMTVLLSKGISYQNAKHIVSQELGHMRASITNTYLR